MLQQYQDDNRHIIVTTKYGDCKIKKYYTKLKPGYTILSAINKTEYFINICKEIYGERYKYDKINYINAKEKIILTCRKHGDFLILPMDIMRKHSNCAQCSKEISRINCRKSKENFIEKSNKKHGNLYDYTDIDYVDRKTKIKIKCKLHGYFYQTPKDHLRGNGCIECAHNKISKSRGENPTGWKYTMWVEASRKSKQFESYKVYIIKCYNEEESFIKIGRTYQSIKRRFRTKRMMPYKYDIITELLGNPMEIYKLEAELKSLCKKDKYIPKINFNGKHECFTEECLKQLSAIPK